MLGLIDIHGRLVIVSNGNINIVNLQLPPIKDVIPASNGKDYYHIILTEDGEVFETDNMTNPTTATKIRDDIRHIINHTWYIIMIDNNDVIHFQEQSIQSHHPIRLINRNVIVLDNDDVYELEIYTRLYPIRLRGNKLIHKMSSISKLVVDSWYILIASDKNQYYIFDREYDTYRRTKHNNPPRKFGISINRE